MANKKYLQKLSRDKELLDHQVMKLNTALVSREKQMAHLQLQKRGGQSSAHGLKDHVSKLPFYMAPGNVGDVNRVIWPFWYTTEDTQVAPNQTVSTGFSVTQEAAYIITSYTKAVYLRTVGPDNISYLDPKFAVGGGKSTGLSVNFRDSQSSRQFMDTTIKLDNVGNPRFVTEFEAPMLLLPNANFEVIFVNENPTDTFIPFITMFGYRMRIEEAKSILAVAGDYK